MVAAMHPGIKLALMVLGIVNKDREEELRVEARTRTEVTRGASCGESYGIIVFIKMSNYSDPGQQTKYKMRSRTGEMGKKFICPLGDTIMSCRCVVLVFVLPDITDILGAPLP